MFSIFKITLRGVAAARCHLRIFLYRRGTLQLLWAGAAVPVHSICGIASLLWGHRSSWFLPFRHCMHSFTFASTKLMCSTWFPCTPKPHALISMLVETSLRLRSSISSPSITLKHVQTKWSICSIILPLISKSCPINFTSNRNLSAFQWRLSAHSSLMFYT